MVWGMNHPPGSNGFDLPGEFEGPADVASNGWRKRLARHFIDHMPEHERTVFEDENGAGAHWYACHAIAKFLIRREYFMGRVPEGVDLAIREHEKPLYFRSTGNFARMASLATLSGPVLTVDEALKSFIEWLEPGVHSFVPVEIRRARDKPAIGIRHILIVERRLDSFSEVHSPKEAFTITPDRSYIQHEEKAALMRQLAFRREKIGDAHLWLEARFGTYLLCMSDRLQAEIADAGLRIPKHLQMREV